MTWYVPWIMTFDHWWSDSPITNHWRIVPLLSGKSFSGIHDEPCIILYALYFIWTKTKHTTAVGLLCKINNEPVLFQDLDHQIINHLWNGSLFPELPPHPTPPPPPHPPPPTPPPHVTMHVRIFQDDSRLASSQCGTSLQSNAVFYWLGANLESALRLRDS